MAANALMSNEGRQNFQRLTRLLIAGATTIGRETFDAIHPPATLATVLADPACQAILRGARMTRPQLQQVYPSPGLFGKSEDWDLTLLHKMLRSICGLTQPSTGWDDLPPDSDISKEADLVRLKYYRNSVYGHVDERMQIKDEEFQKLWKDISEAIIRLAGHLSSAKKKEWEDAIEDFLTAPLTSDDLLNIEELKSWYQQDVEIRQELLNLKIGVNELIKPTKERTLDPTVDTCPIAHHDNQLVEWFCEACRECVCRTCVTLHHTSHPCVNMNNPAHMQTVIQELLDTSAKVRCEIEKHKKLIQEIKKKGALRNNQLNKLKNEIKNTVNKWIVQLREQEEKLHKDIEATGKVYQETDDNQVNKYAKHVENMETWVKYTEKLANEGSAVNKVTQKEQTLKCKDEVIAVDLKTEPQTITGCQFIENEILSRDIKDIGTVSLWDCEAEGEGLQHAIVGVPSTVTFKTVAICGKQRQIVHYPTVTLSVKIHSPQDTATPAIQDNKDGTYKVSFVPTHPGDHEISATVEGQEIPGSPFFVKVNQCILNDSREGIVGLKSRSKDDLLTQRNEQLNDSNVVSKVKPRSLQVNPFPLIQDTNDMSFISTHIRDYENSAAVDSQEIPGSPLFTANVKQNVLTGKNLIKGVVGLRSQFKVSFHDKYDGKVDNPTIALNVEIQSPKDTVIPAIQNNKDGTHLVSFFPVQPGDHQVCVIVRNEFSGNENQQQKNVNQRRAIPCNSFTVAVKPRKFEVVLTFGKSGNKTGEFMLPWGVAVNDNDEIIVADRDNHRVQVFSCKGEHLRTIGKKGTGAGRLDRPYGVVSGKNNNIIIADSGNCLVHMFTESGEFIRSFGSKGRDNGQLKGPTGLSLDTDGNIIVTDCGNGRVQVFSNHGKWLESFDCGERPRHCVVHDEHYYVSSHSDHSIKVFDMRGIFLCRYGARGSTPGAFIDPSGLAVDKAGNLIVCDTWNNRMQVLEMDGTFVDSFGVEGEGLGQVRSPSTAAVMRDGKIVVCDTCNDRIQVFE